MSLPARRAFALQSAFVNSIRATANDPPSEELLFVKDLVRGFAKDGAEESCKLPLDKFLQQSVDTIYCVTRTRYGTCSNAITVILERTKHILQAISCAQCRKCDNICAGVDHQVDSRIVAESEAPCIGQIKVAFRFAQDLTAKYITSYLGADLPGVKLTLETSGFSEEPSNVCGIKLAISGHTTFRDLAEQKRSVVCFEVAPLQLTRESLALLPAIALHEVFCHGYQMVNSSDPRINIGAIADPLSEGLMNDLAVEMLEEHARDFDQSTADGQLWRANVNSAKELALLRSSLDKDPCFKQAFEISLGRYVLDLLKRLYSLSNRTNSEENVRALALALNLHQWSNDQRFAGISKLATGLTRKPRDSDLIALLMEFPKARDPTRIVEHLSLIK